MVDRILKAILLFTPIAYCVGVNYYKFEVIFFQVTSMVLIASSLFDTPKRKFKIKKLITLFFGVCLLSVAVNGFEPRGMTTLVSIFLGCASIYVLTVYSENLQKCFKWLLIGLGINAVICIGQHLGYSPFIGTQGLGKEFGGIIGNAPRFATFLTLCVAFVHPFGLIILVIMGAVLTESVLSLAALIMLLIRIYKSNFTTRRVFLFLTGLIFFGLIFLCWKKIIFNPSYIVRISIWKNIVTNLAQRPFSGFGLGFFNVADYGFSSFFQWIYGVGFLGIGFVVICVKRMRVCLVPLLLLCFVEYPFEIPRLWPVIIFTIAYYAIEQKEDILWD